MNAQVLIALRFLTGKGGSRRTLASTVSLISLVGVVLGVMVPIIVLSVMMGFQEEIKSKILGVKGHIVLSASSVEKEIQNYPVVLEKIRKMPGVVSANPYVEIQGMAQFYSGFEPVLIRGVPPDYFEQDSEIDKLLFMTAGRKKLTRRYEMIMGSTLADRKLVGVGERINIVFSDDENLTLNSRPKTVATSVVGTFKTGFQQFDEGIIYVSMSTFNKIFRRQNVVKKIDIKVEDIFNLEPVIVQLVASYGSRYRIYTWQDINFNFFKALALEKSLMHFIVTLILIVAIFNVTSSQLIFIIEKKREIGILKTIGMRPFQIAQIFLLQGLVITSIGAVIGGILGYLVTLDLMIILRSVEFIADLFFYTFYEVFSLVVDLGPYRGVEIFPVGVYYLDYIPTDVSILRTVFFVFMATVLSGIVGFLPAYKASRLKPVDIMRYE